MNYSLKKWKYPKKTKTWNREFAVNSPWIRREFAVNNREFVHVLIIRFLCILPCVISVGIVCVTAIHAAMYVTMSTICALVPMWLVRFVSLHSIAQICFFILIYSHSSSYFFGFYLLFCQICFHIVYTLICSYSFVYSLCFVFLCFWALLWSSIWVACPVLCFVVLYVFHVCGLHALNFAFPVTFLCFALSAYL
jgi:hypothetical protein